MNDYLCGMSGSNHTKWRFSLMVSDLAGSGVGGGVPGLDMPFISI